MNIKFTAGGVIATLGLVAALGAAQPMLPERQTELVLQYCAVCHTDAAKNGGLTLEHYDAAKLNPALAAMLLSKLHGGAMGAAGLGVPDKQTQQDWIDATAAQAVRSKFWSVIREPQSPVMTASIVREVPPLVTKHATRAYRLTLACNSAEHRGSIQLTWSPEPQTGRSFSVSADGHAVISHKLEGHEDKMGNGVALRAGLASAVLNVPFPQRTLTVTELFPGETVVFPVSELDPGARRDLQACFPVPAPF